MKKKGIPFFITFTNIDDEDVGEGDVEGMLVKMMKKVDEEEGYTLLHHLHQHR